MEARAKQNEQKGLASREQEVVWYSSLLIWSKAAPEKRVYYQTYIYLSDHAGAAAEDWATQKSREIVPDPDARVEARRMR
jgi:hypothetical protein